MRKTAAYAFHHSIPILIGFFPVGIAYGLLMQQAGYNFLWSGACSLFVLAGSLQFLMVTFFAGGVSLATVAVLALLLNSRHIFYGLSFIDKFRSFGPWRWFLIYSLCDENYSLHCSHDFGPDVNEKWAYVLTAAFVTFYWVALSMLGGLVGALIPFDTTGIDFALTALFTVIVVDQLRGARTRIPAVVAAVSSIGALLLLGGITACNAAFGDLLQGRVRRTLGELAARLFHLGGDLLLPLHILQLAQVLRAVHPARRCKLV